jgi:hypothetical protein
LVVGSSNKQRLVVVGRTYGFFLKFKVPVNVLQTLINVAPTNLAFIKFSEGQMALHLVACSSVSIKLVEYLLEENITALNEQDSLGNLPVHCAVKHSAPYEVITFLMSH